jgi:hypothetical protein
MNSPGQFLTNAVRALAKFMTILLQNQKTLNYVAGPESWTADIERACAFNTGLEAFCFCLANHIRDMQILGKFDDTRMNFTVAVTNRRTG